MVIMTNTFDWKITFGKFGKSALIVIIAGIASVYGDNPYYLALAPIISGISNALKHKYGIDLKVI